MPALASDPSENTSNPPLPAIHSHLSSLSPLSPLFLISLPFFPILIASSWLVVISKYVGMLLLLDEMINFWIDVKISDHKEVGVRLFRKRGKGLEFLDEGDRGNQEAEEEVRNVGGMPTVIIGKGTEKDEPSEHHQAQVGHQSGQWGLLHLLVHRKGSVQIDDLTQVTRGEAGRAGNTIHYQAALRGASLHP